MTLAWDHDTERNILAWDEGRQAASIRRYEVEGVDVLRLCNFLMNAEAAPALPLAEVLVEGDLTTDEHASKDRICLGPGTV